MFDIALRNAVVPNFINCPIEGAGTWLKEHDLGVATTDPQPSETIARGLISDQTPKPGDRLVRAITYVLTLSSGPPATPPPPRPEPCSEALFNAVIEAGRVPEFRQCAFEAASAWLVAHGFPAPSPNWQPSKTTPRGIIFDQNPLPNGPREGGSTFLLIVSSGPPGDDRHWWERPPFDMPLPWIAIGVLLPVGAALLWWLLRKPPVPAEPAPKSGHHPAVPDVHVQCIDSGARKAAMKSGEPPLAAPPVEISVTVERAALRPCEDLPILEEREQWKK